MPTVQANGIDIYYEVQGEGEPLVLIPYLAADQACYAFQIADYAKHFTCFTVDLRGAGLCSKPEGDYTTELLAGPLTAAIPGAEVVVFENCSHAPIYEDVDGFNQQTLAFLRQHAG